MKNNFYIIYSKYPILFNILNIIILGLLSKWNMVSECQPDIQAAIVLANSRPTTCDMQNGSNILEMANALYNDNFIGEITDAKNNLTPQQLLEYNQILLKMFLITKNENHIQILALINTIFINQHLKELSTGEHLHSFLRDVIWLKLEFHHEEKILDTDDLNQIFHKIFTIIINREHKIRNFIQDYGYIYTYQGKLL